MDRMLIAFVLTLLGGAIQGFLAEPLANPLGLDMTEERLRVYHDLKDKLKNLRIEESRQMFGSDSYGERPLALFITGGESTLSVVPLEVGNTSIVDGVFDNTEPLDIVIEDVIQEFLVLTVMIKVLAAPERQMIVILWTTDYNEQALDYKENAKRVSETADFITEIIRTIDASGQALDRSLTRLLTSGLSSHLGGRVGQNVRGLKEIIALNPTNKYFSTSNSENYERLHKRNAHQVSVYYTSSSIGLIDEIGDINYHFIVGDSYRENFYGTVRNFDLCYHKLAAMLYYNSAFDYLKLGPAELEAHKCPSYAKYKIGRCHETPRAPYGYFADTSLKGSYMVKMEIFDTKDTTGVSFANDYCKEYPIVMRPVRVKFWTKSAKNRGYIVAMSQVAKGNNGDSAEYDYKSNFQYILNSKSKNTGLVWSSLQVPLLASMDDVQYFLRFRNRPLFSGNFTIDKMIMSWKDGTNEYHMSACNIDIAPLIDHPPLDLVPGDKCGR